MQNIQHDHNLKAFVFLFFFLYLNTRKKLRITYTPHHDQSRILALTS